MKKIIILLIVLVLIGCSSVKEKSNNRLIIIKTNEFIDITSSSVKLLFNTEIDSDIKIYLGEDKNNLKLIKEIKKYNFKNGVDIDGLIPGKIYYYKIICKKDGRKAESKIEMFTKIDRKNIKEKAEWARTAVFYEVFVRSFYDSNKDGIGDINGLKEKSRT